MLQAEAVVSSDRAPVLLYEPAPELAASGHADPAARCSPATLREVCAAGAVRVTLVGSKDPSLQRRADDMGI